MSMLQEESKLTDISVAELMIPSEKVAHVQINNPLEHALLVLVKSGYSAVPVLDTSYKLVGMISKTVILNEILGIEIFISRMALCNGAINLVASKSKATNT